MNSRQAIKKIMDILNLSPQKFYEGKNEQGIVMKMEGDLEVGKSLYVQTEEGLLPVPDGEHKMEDGTVIETMEGMISKIKMGDMEVDNAQKEEDKTEVGEKMSVELEFGDVKLKDGSVLRIGMEGPEVGIEIKKVNYDGSVDAISDGQYETSTGKVLTITGGLITGMVDKSDSPMEKGQQQVETGVKAGFVEAKADSGVLLESPTFDVGEDVMVVGEDGEKSKAPDGEHQVVLKDESGNENKIRFTTKDGKITERENVEEEKMNEVEIAEIFAMALKKFEDKLDSIDKRYSSLESKFEKFSSEPAGSKIYDQKTINETSESSSKFEQFKRFKERLSHN
jgi:hypothetical protein